MGFVQKSLQDAAAFTSFVDPQEVAGCCDASGRVVDPARLKAHEDSALSRFLAQHELPAGDGRRNVVFFAADLSGCGYVRCFLPASSLQRHSTRYNAVVSTVVCPELVRWADVIVWQRQSTPRWVHLFHLAKGNRRAQIYELDDNIHNISPQSPAYRTCNPSLPSYAISADWMRHCDAVLVSTGPLKEFYDQWLTLDCRVIENTVDVARLAALEAPREFDRVRILWAGSSTHIEDLAVVRRAVRRLKERRGKDVKFLMMGWDGRVALPAAGPQDGGAPVQGWDLGIRCDKFVPWVDVEEYHRRLHELSIDIGLCPLAMNLFNRGKSNIKWLEYSLAGAATVATDLEPYNRSVVHGETGLLVRGGDDEWLAAIERLVDDAPLRSRLVENARQAIRERFDCDGVWRRYEELFDEVLARVTK